MLDAGAESGPDPSGPSDPSTSGAFDQFDGGPDGDVDGDAAGPASGSPWSASPRGDLDGPSFPRGDLDGSSFPQGAPHDGRGVPKTPDPGDGGPPDPGRQRGYYDPYFGDDADFGEFLAFVGWYAFLIFCCLLPTICAYYRRRRHARVLRENFVNIQERLAEIERRRGEAAAAAAGGAEGNEGGLPRGADSRQDWEVRGVATRPRLSANRFFVRTSHVLFPSRPPPPSRSETTGSSSSSSSDHCGPATGMTPTPRAGGPPWPTSWGGRASGPWWSGSGSADGSGGGGSSRRSRRRARS